MCIADTSTNPSWIPAAARQFSTSSVMSMISCRFRVLNVRYDVWVFIWRYVRRVKRIGFRGRLFLILFAFALVPSMVLTLAWSGATWWIVPLVSSNAAWDSTAASGARALTAARDDRGSSTDSVAFARHEQLLREGQLRSRQSGFFLRRVALAFGISALLAFLGLIVIASRVAGHLSRNLSRPLQELVGWTERIARGEGVPDEPAAKGAPEFEMLRGRMREMSLELEKGRRAALEAERGAAMRETARQVAHELKNPLTPIRFAVERLRRDAPAALQESIE